MRIIEFFIDNENYDKNSIKYHKAKVLSIILFITIVLLFVLLVKNIIANQTQTIIKVVLTMGILFFPLFIIKKGRNELAGSIIISLVMALQVFSMITNPKGAELPYFLMQQYYVFPLLIIGAAMFASRSVMIINFLIIVFFSIYIFVIKVELIPENVAKISQYGFVVFEVTFVMIFAFSFLFTSFMNRVISNLSEKSITSENQNIIMRKMVDQIKLSSNEIASASNQLNSISQELTKNANEQAQTAGNTADLMKQILESITLNTQNAKHTQSKSVKSSENLQNGSKIIIETIKLVSQISAKTKIISDIAFQANILSLNASIEAARAGIEGKGFAVVAQEMGKLAYKSKIESSEIEKLSVSGKSVSEATANVLEKTLSEISEIADLVSNISNTGNEQKNNAVIVNSSIQQLSALTNHTSASAEQMSASAQELSAQAEHLNQIVKLFNESN